VAANPTDFDWLHPDYEAEWRARAERLRRLRATPGAIAAAKVYYRSHPADFISHFGVTTDPRSIAKGKPSLIPFLLWSRQIELIAWIMERWRRSEPGTVVKSRDVGASWCAMALLGTLAVFERGFAAGIVSATEVKLDRADDPDTLMYKAREFLKHLPIEFRGGYVEEKNSSYLRLTIPATGSTITGEAGENAGRGGRKSLVIADESSHFLHPKAVDAALAATSECRIDLSSVRGTANSFYERATNSNIPRFDITWRDDPRKDAAWYEQLRGKFDPALIGAEYDCNFLASTERQLIESAWIDSIIGAHYKLEIPPTGVRVAALDVADQGSDRNAFVGRHGILVAHAQSWSGAGSSIFASVVRTMGLCDEFRYSRFMYDVVGLGAGVGGDAEEINRQRAAAGRPRIYADPYAGSASPPEGSLIPDRENADAFANMKSYSWWTLRERVRLTDRVIREGLKDYNPDALISLHPDLPELNRLIAELGQVQWSRNAVGKLIIEKTPDGARSPNLADSLCIAFSPDSTAETQAMWASLGDARSPEQQRAQSVSGAQRRAFEAECRAYRKRLAGRR
jgi:phage terminase large subunit